MNNNKMSPDAKRLLKFFLVISLLFIVTEIGMRIDDRKEYYFIITKIETGGNGHLTIYNKDETVGLNNYVVTKFSDIKVGDSLSKPKFAEYLRIYRKDSISDEYVEVAKIYRR